MANHGKGKRWGMALATLGLLVIAACQATGGSVAEDALTDNTTVEGDEVAAADATAAAGAAAEEDEEAARLVPAVLAQATADRKVITTAEVSIEAKDTRAAYDALVAEAERAGGFIADAAIDDGGGESEQPVVRVTLRVPATSLNAVLDRVQSLGERVVSLDVGTQDVTEEFVDLEARLTNLVVLEEELRLLLAEVREEAAGKPAALLQVYEQIRITREEIELIQGRQRLLDDLVALATISVTVTPSPVVAPVVDDGWQPQATAREAARNTTEAFQQMVDAAIWFGLYLLPVLLVIAIPTAVIWWLVRRRRRATPPVAPVAEG